MTIQQHNKKRTLCWLVLAILILAGCDGTVDPPEEFFIQGVVMDEDGNTYVEVPVTLRRMASGTTLQDQTTSAGGSFSFRLSATGSYEVVIEPPRDSEVVGMNPVAVTVAAEMPARADFTIRTLPIEGKVVGVEGFDPQGHLKNASGQRPESPDEPLYHLNDPEQLHPITAPDGHHVTLGEWQQAHGTGRATCNGNSGTHYILILDGLIPQGVYSVWTVLFDEPQPQTLGIGVLGRVGNSEHVFTASASGQGQLEVTLPPGPMSIAGSAPACLLTEVPQSFVQLIYHINGQAPGGQGPIAEPQGTWVDQLYIGTPPF